MRATSVLRAVLVLCLLGSISVAGTAIVWSAGGRVLSSLASDLGLLPAEQLQSVEPLQDVQAGGLEKRLRNYRVRLRADGRLPGRINVIDPETGLVAPAREMTIALLQNGQVKAEFRPGIDGVFEAEGVQPGVYSLIGHGEEGYIAYGLEVLPAELTVDNQDDFDISPVMFQEIEQELAIDSLAVPATDGPSVLQLATSYLPKDVIAQARQRSADAASGPAQPLEAPERIDLDEQQDSPVDEALPSANIRQYDIRLSTDGSLTGRMRSLNPASGQPVRFRRLNVFVVRDNEIVAQAPVSPLGVFTLPELTEGYYSFVAAGTEGFTAFSIRTVTEAIAGHDTLDELTVPVAFQAGAADPAIGFFGTVASVEDLSYLVYKLLFYYGQPGEAEAFAQQFGGPAGPGGGGFGGGAGGAGGGLGGGGGGVGSGLLETLFGAAFAGAIIAAIDNASSNNVTSAGQIATPSSPTTPAQ